MHATRNELRRVYALLVCWLLSCGWVLFFFIILFLCFFSFLSLFLIFFSALYISVDFTALINNPYFSHFRSMKVCAELKAYFQMANCSPETFRADIRYLFATQSSHFMQILFWAKLVLRENKKNCFKWLILIQTSSKILFMLHSFSGCPSLIQHLIQCLF